MVMNTNDLNTSTEDDNVNICLMQLYFLSITLFFLLYIPVLHSYTHLCLAISLGHPLQNNTVFSICFLLVKLLIYKYIFLFLLLFILSPSIILIPQMQSYILSSLFHIYNSICNLSSFPVFSLYVLIMLSW